MNVSTKTIQTYAQNVVKGKVKAGRLVIKACERFLNDVKRSKTKAFQYEFKEDLAEKVIKFFRYTKHTKGELAGKPIELEPFQMFILGNIFGWVHKETGLRRFRKAYIQLARKNAKSTLLSGVGLYMLMDKEGGGEVYATATKREQAKIVFGDAQTMAKGSKALRTRLKITRDEIKHPVTNSKMMALSKDTKTLDGFNPYLGIIDEYHAHPTSEMYDVIVSGMGQRTQPLIFIITTAGFNLSSPCYTEFQYCEKLMEGTLKNDEYFVYIAQMDKDDDIKDPKNWVKANPLMAKSKNGMKYLKSEFSIAQDVPEKMRNFLTKNLNIWVDQKEDGYMQMDKWKECSNGIPNLEGRECYIGIDLSKKIDLTSISFVFPFEDGTFAVKSHSFIPEDTLKEKRRTDKVPYDLWVNQGWITATEGAVVDYRYIMRYIHDVVTENKWVVKEIDYDPYAATMLAQEMEDLGYTVVEIRQGVKSLSEGTKDFREKVVSKRILHEDDPVLTWAISNAVIKVDHNENIMLDKAKSSERIDPIAATINAYVRAMGHFLEPNLNAHILNEFTF